MNERDNFALVPRRPGALEKAEPGAKRILSGMVADTLVLVKKEPQSKTIFFAAMCGFVWNPKQFDEMIADNLLEFVPARKGKVELKCFTWTNELINATRRLRFDLFILLLNPHLYCWKSQNEAPVRANLDVGDMSNTSETNAYELIASLKREFKKPILAVSNGYYSTTELEAAGADAFLGMPFTSDEFRSALEACGILQAADLPRKRHPPRIIVVDDDDDWVKLVEAMIQDWFKDAETVTFNSSQAALRELEQRAPDLLITGDKMPRMTGDELVRRLIAKNVNYPILVLTGHDEAQQWVREYASRGFNVRFQPKRGVEHELKRSIEEILSPQRGTVEKSEEITPQPCNKRAPRIVILDDEEAVRESHSLLLKHCYEGVEILKFGDARDAWQELSHRNPDLFITDIHHAWISCEEILSRLVERKVTFPILIISAYEKVDWRSWGPGLSVSFLSKPISLEEFRTAVETALQMPARRAP